MLKQVLLKFIAFTLERFWASVTLGDKVRITFTEDVPQEGLKYFEAKAIDTVFVKKTGRLVSYEVKCLGFPWSMRGARLIRAVPIEKDPNYNPIHEIFFDGKHYPVRIRNVDRSPSVYPKQVSEGSRI